MGKGDTGRPQQPELARSERGRVDPHSWPDVGTPDAVPGDRGATGPVPEENRPGHHPEKEQDKPQGPPEEAEESAEGSEPEDPTLPADQAKPESPGPGDSEGARPE
jgi:hypothetical protein